MNLWDFLPQLAAQLGIAPSQLLFYIGFTTFAANIAARLIPQDSVGWLGQVRRVCAIIGAYVPSRVSGNISVTDVAKSVIGAQVNDATGKVIHDAAATAGSLIPDVVEDIAAQPVVDVFNKYRQTLELDPDDSK